eukprot:572214-Pleurochrysis_carterae.AAC.1
MAPYQRIALLSCRRHQYGTPLRPWRYEALRPRQRGACFEALYQRKTELTKRHAKQSVADESYAEKKPRNLSSLHIKHDVN